MTDLVTTIVAHLMSGADSIAEDAYYVHIIISSVFLMSQNQLPHTSVFFLCNNY